MESLYKALVLGIVEGLTEFLPVSSTGHLILAGHALDFTGPKASIFEIVIQLGAILAVVALYWQRFQGLLRPEPATALGPKRFAGLRGIWLLVLTSLPASLVGLAAHSAIQTYLFSPRPVAIALAVGSIMIFAVEARHRQTRYTSLDDVTPRLALGVGLFQCLALWPGFSRSAASIMGGMILGANRRLAADYSFIAAVPIMCAATGYSMLKDWQLFNSGDLIFLSTGFVISFLSAWAAVKGFIYLLGRLTLRPFAVYRLVLAGLVLALWN